MKACISHCICITLFFTITTIFQLPRMRYKSLPFNSIAHSFQFQTIRSGYAWTVYPTSKSKKKIVVIYGKVFLPASENFAGFLVHTPDLPKTSFFRILPRLAGWKHISHIVFAYLYFSPSLQFFNYKGWDISLYLPIAHSFQFPYLYSNKSKQHTSLDIFANRISTR